MCNGLLTAVEVDGSGGEKTSILDELAIGEKFPVKMLKTGKPTGTYAASILATYSFSDVHK